MNGPLVKSMYHLRPVFQLKSEIDLPKNMYSLPKVQAVGEPTHVLHSIQDKVKKILKSEAGDSAALEERWDAVLVQLQDLKLQLAEIKKSVQSNSDQSTVTPSIPSNNSISLSADKEKLQLLEGAVINANPNSLPYSLLLIQKLYKDKVNIKISCHIHSTASTTTKDLTEKFQQSKKESNGVPIINLFLIWKEGILDTQLVINPLKQIAIHGEVNILRYLCRLGLAGLQYSNENDISILATEAILDTCHRLLHVRTAKEKISIARHLNGKLGKNSFFGGENINISDIAAWSSFKQIDLASSADLSQNLSKWFARVDAVMN